jgi:hypothetical protein
MSAGGLLLGELLFTRAGATGGGDPPPLVSTATAVAVVVVLADAPPEFAVAAELVSLPIEAVLVLAGPLPEAAATAPLLPLVSAVPPLTSWATAGTVSATVALRVAAKNPANAISHPKRNTPRNITSSQDTQLTTGLRKCRRR